MCMKRNKKIRVNITVEEVLLKKAKSKLYMFGGKLSTLFNAYLNDFVNREISTGSYGELRKKIKELEIRLKKIEKKLKD